MMMMMPFWGGKKHTTMDVVLSLFDVSLSLFLAPQILLDKERKKERKKEKKTAFFFFFFFFFFSFPPKLFKR